MKRDLRQDAMTIFQAGLKAADPYKAVQDAIFVQGEGVYSIAGQTLDLSRFDRVFVVGAGKAACPMALALEELLPKISAGKIVTKYGHLSDLKYIDAIESGHPVPDENGAAGAKGILELLEDATENDLVFSVISGGGSALLAMPAPGISLAQKQETTSVLLACGAEVHDINTIRRHISLIKGGGMARAAYPATMVNLVLSDVIGDDLDAIASGPTVPDPTTFDKCLGVLDCYDIRKKVFNGKVF